ncbi:NAD(P)H-dependent oxidoreductase [Brevibacterium spongiae]|uniref:NAD(P)H-dependent oxidoreductase n=1 Tax=Brevibacterium spongiae TaxID=2909672 RepID=A0ABY5SP15_9MICO|nr:NAD(P)H-dependent oxidoreductase [Brevibacterium spongiae]UVI36268.1 NAD(P)H-dependent oxidoreductase [Brevibacterium spongiae]
MQYANSPSSILWLSAHPESRSLNGSLRKTGVAHLRRHGHTVLESDLYAMDWDPVLRPRDGGHDVETDDPSTEAAESADKSARSLDRFRVSADTRTAYRTDTQHSEVVREQEKLRRADAIVVQFPLWWYGMPAILKGWFDRVFVSGFAFGTDEATGRRLRFEQGPFTGKRTLIVTTLGDRPHAIGPRGKSGELNELLFGLLHGTFAYTGMSVLDPFAVPSADQIDDITPISTRLIDRLDGLFTEPPIPYRPQFTGDYTPEWELAPHVRPGEHGVRIHTAS